MLKQDQDKIFCQLSLCLGLIISLSTASLADNEPELSNKDLPVAHISSSTINQLLQNNLKSSAQSAASKQSDTEHTVAAEQQSTTSDQVHDFTYSQASLPALGKLPITDPPASVNLPNPDPSELFAPINPELLSPTKNLIGAVILPIPFAKPETINDEPVVIDNDESTQTEATIKYEDLPTDAGKTRIKAGARFPVVITSEITSKSAKEGDPVQARLKYDLKIGDHLVAQKGSLVNGHLSYVLKARSAMHSLVSPERWYRNSGALKLTFDEIVNGKDEHLPLVAQPARQARIIKNKGEGRELGVNHDGLVTGPWSQQLRYKAIRIGLNAAMTPCGVFSFGAMPVALGLIGAANPSFAFMKPVGQNVRHRRIKGFCWGFLSGVPGSWIVEDTVIKGQEAVIKPGDEFLAEFNEEFTGEPATDASLIPGASTKVHGQIMPK